MILESQAWTDVPLRLDPRVAREIAHSPLAENLEEPPDRWRLMTGSSVGVALVEDWELRVHARIPIPKLLVLLAYAHDQRGWRENDGGIC